MITVINSSAFNQALLNDRSIIYTSSKKDTSFLESFNNILNPNTHRNQFDPFAYVVLNQITNEFLLVRDHLGVQPLYYYYQAASKTLIFGETIPDVLACLGSEPALLETEVLNLFSDLSLYSDDTLYEGIHRVEPGHMIHGQSNGQLVKKPFWCLEKEGETLYYKDDGEYLEHFSALMSEAVRDATEGSDNIASEFSAGIDSSAVYAASAARGLKPALFMHAATPGSRSAETYNDTYEKAFLKHYQPSEIYRIKADGFDPMDVLEKYATWFAGPSPYIFEVFAHNVHQAVSEKGHPILLSGFGGDQGVSGHMPIRFILPELLKNKAFGSAWHELSSQKVSRRLLRLIQYSHPVFNRVIQNIQGIRKENHIHPYQKIYFKTLREAEWSFLQGPFSHEIRMRIEYSSIVSKKMGFEYRYPLLHPNLLAFFLALPLSQKRHLGVGRYLIRRYLARQMPGAIFDTYQKKEGLNILPATMDYFKPRFLEGVFDGHFKALPYADLIQDKMEHRMMIKNIQAFMLKMS